MEDPLLQIEKARSDRRAVSSKKTCGGAREAGRGVKRVGERLKGRMTEYWKSSQTNYWCEVCKCWVRDSVQGRALHESGPKHRDLLERKLR